MNRIIFVMIVLASIVGCSGPVYVYVFNNSGAVVVANALGEKISIESQRMGRFKVINEVGVCTGGKLFTYYISSNLPPGKYYGTKHFPKHSVHFQLQPDGMLFLALPNAEMPLKNMDQPKGFPLSPNAIGACNA